MTTKRALRRRFFLVSCWPSASPDDHTEGKNSTISSVTTSSGRQEQKGEEEGGGGSGDGETPPLAESPWFRYAKLFIVVRWRSLCRKVDQGSSRFRVGLPFVFELLVGCP